MAYCICEWWKKSMGYNFVPECNHLCQTTVCWDLEILLPWQCDVVTSPVYWQVIFQEMVHKTYIYFKALQLWCWEAPSSSPSLTSSCICFSFALSTPYATLEHYSINSQLVHLMPIAILIMAKTSNNRRLWSAGNDDLRSKCSQMLLPQHCTFA